MAADPIEYPGSESPDSAAGLLAALESTHTELTRHEIDRFRLAVDWAAAHPAEGLDTAAAVAGTEGEVAIAGPGAPLVAEFCIPEFALAVGMSTDAGRCYLGDAVEVRYRLPRLWAMVMGGRVPVWKARRIATHTHSLPVEAAAHVDRHLAPTAHRVGYAQIDRTVEAARALFDPIEAEHRRLLAAEARFCHVDTRQVSLNGTMSVRPRCREQRTPDGPQAASPSPRAASTSTDRHRQSAHSRPRPFLPHTAPIREETRDSCDSLPNAASTTG